MEQDKIQAELISKIIGDTPTTPLERAWAIRNHIGRTFGRHDLANEIGALMCDMLLPYMIDDKMAAANDDDCTEYWFSVKEYLLTNR